jgi:acyl transferase domain-containing protein
MVINHNGGADRYTTASATLSTGPEAYRQEPVAVIGFANRLPGHSDNPTKLWELLERGGVAGNEPPASRWSLKGHFDGSRKPHTVRTPGAMFVENVDAADFDASFFSISTADAISIDPQQRQLLEVVYEGIENAGLSLEKLDGAAYGCFVGSYAVDYQDIQMRDPEDRADGMTIGVGRAILSNRLSHFLNIKGASMTIDTACSGSLVAVDVACRYIQTGQIEGAIVAASNLYLCPEQNQDMGAMRAASSFSGKCHTFDAKADGYCKAEGINTIILKKLSDALRDGDPIRAVIRGTATNSDGWTPGIASPNAKAQTQAMRAAFSAANIIDLNEIGYLEAHGTGTLAGKSLYPS